MTFHFEAEKENALVDILSHLPRERGFPAARPRGYDYELTVKKPDTYTLGAGHVLFFYDKLYYLIDRYQELCNEMYHRGFTVNYPHVPEFVWDLRLHWFGEYTPTQEALEINRERIAQRLRGE